MSEINLDKSRENPSSSDKNRIFPDLGLDHAINEELNYPNQIPLDRLDQDSHFQHHSYIFSGKTHLNQGTDELAHYMQSHDSILSTSQLYQASGERQSDVSNKILPVSELIKSNQKENSSYQEQQSPNLDRWLQKPSPQREDTTSVNKTIVSIGIAILAIVLLSAVYWSGYFSKNNRAIDKLVSVIRISHNHT